MKEPFTLQKEEISYRATRVGGGYGAPTPCFKLGSKTPVSVFLFLFNKSILKQQHVENSAKGAEIDVSELLKLA